MSASTNGPSPRSSLEVSGTIHLDGNPDDVFPLFTAEGERGWVPNWEPRYPAYDVPEESPGTTFLTLNHGLEAIWVIVDRDETRHRGRYVCVIPNTRAALITIVGTPTRSGQSQVHVTYAVTSLSAEADEAIREFGEGFPDMLSGWKTLIEAASV